MAKKLKRHQKISLAIAAVGVVSSITVAVFLGVKDSKIDPVLFAICSSTMSLVFAMWLESMVLGSVIEGNLKQLDAGIACNTFVNRLRDAEVPNGPRGRFYRQHAKDQKEKIEHFVHKYERVISHRPEYIWGTHKNHFDDLGKGETFRATCVVPTDDMAAENLYKNKDYLKYCEATYNPETIAAKKLDVKKVFVMDSRQIDIDPIYEHLKELQSVIDQLNNRTGRDAGQGSLEARVVFRDHYLKSSLGPLDLVSKDYMMWHDELLAVSEVGNEHTISVVDGVTLSFDIDRIDSQAEDFEKKLYPLANSLQTVLN